MKKNNKTSDLKYLRKKLIISRSNYIYNKTLPKQTDFDKKKIEEIIFKKKSTLTVNFYDSLIYDEHKEFLKRYYSFEDILVKIPQISSYINSVSKLYPNYIDMNVSRYIFKNISCKQNLLDQNYKLELEKLDHFSEEFEQVFNNSLLREIDLETARKKLDHKHRDINNEETSFKRIQLYDSMDSVEKFLDYIDQTEESRIRKEKQKKIVNDKSDDLSNTYKIVYNFLDQNNNEIPPLKINEKLKTNNLSVKSSNDNLSSNKNIPKLNLTREKPITFFHYHNLNIKKELEAKENFSEKEPLEKMKHTVICPEETKNYMDDEIEENTKKIKGNEIFYTSEIKLLLKKLEKKKNQQNPSLNKTNKASVFLNDSLNLEDQIFKNIQERSDDFALFSNAKKQSSNIKSCNKLRSFYKDNELTNSYNSNIPIKIGKSIYSAISNFQSSTGNFKNSISTRDELSYLKTNTIQIPKFTEISPKKMIYQKISSNLFIEEKININRIITSSCSNLQNIKKKNKFETTNKVNHNKFAISKIKIMQNQKKGKALDNFTNKTLQLSSKIHKNQKIKQGKSGQNFY